MPDEKSSMAVVLLETDSESKRTQSCSPCVSRDRHEGKTEGLSCGVVSRVRMREVGMLVSFTVVAIVFKNSGSEMMSLACEAEMACFSS